jgi:hypothetical protein
MNIRKRDSETDPEDIIFYISILTAMILAFFLTYIEYWQFILVAGIIPGLFNKKMKRGIYSGAIGVAVVWLIYMIYGMVTRNSYTNIDQFAGLIFGDIGYGWVIVILILLFGTLFGALGGSIGSGITILISLRSETRESEPNSSKLTEKTNEIKK